HVAVQHELAGRAGPEDLPHLLGPRGKSNGVSHVYLCFWPVRGRGERGAFSSDCSAASSADGSTGARGSAGTSSRSAEVMSVIRSACWSSQREVSLSVDETESSRAERASGERLTALSSRTRRTCCSIRSSSASITARLLVAASRLARRFCWISSVAR